MPQSSRRLRERRNGLCGCLKVFWFARTATRVRACKSEGTACVVVSGTRFESFFYFFFLHVQPRTYGHILVILNGRLNFESIFLKIATMWYNPLLFTVSNIFKLLKMCVCLGRLERLGSLGIVPVCHNGNMTGSV